MRNILLCALVAGSKPSSASQQKFLFWPILNIQFFLINNTYTLKTLGYLTWFCMNTNVFADDDTTLCHYEHKFLTWRCMNTSVFTVWTHSARSKSTLLCTCYSKFHSDHKFLSNIGSQIYARMTRNSP